MLKSLNLCYLGLYHRKSILYFSTIHLGKYVPDKCVFRNGHTINNNHLFISSRRHRR